MDLGIAGRTAIVCASSRGLGFACAKALAQADCEVVINGRDETRLTAAAAELKKAGNGARITPVAADVATSDGQQALLAACPQPDILVNNNGGPPFRDFRELDRQKMLDGVIANMVVAIELIQKVIDPMIARKFGRIVNITSASVKMPLAGLDLSSGAPLRTSPSISFFQARSTPIVSAPTSKRRQIRKTSATMPPSPNASPPYRQNASASPMNLARCAHFFARHMPAISPGRTS